MNWNAIGSLSDLLAAFGVIVTLIYLAIQIRENSLWMKRQAFDSIAERQGTWCARVRDDPEILAIYLKGNRDFESFDDTDRARYHLTKVEVLAIIESALEHAKMDGLKIDAADAAKTLLAQELKGVGANLWWQQMGRKYFSADFCQTADALVREAAS